MWEYFQAGGPMMWPLLACSVTALAVILERCWFWGRLRPQKDEAAANEFLAALPAGKPSSSGGILTRMLIAGLNADRQNCGKAMEVIALAALADMRRGMSILDTIITAAPMLGIMGTVLGIINSFDMLGAAGVGDPKAVISGIAQALITTAAGLAVAVATIFPYNYFNSRLDRAQDLLEIYGTRLEILRAAQTSRACS